MANIPHAGSRFRRPRLFAGVGLAKTGKTDVSKRVGPFGNNLEKLVEKEVYGSGRIHVSRCRKVEEIRACHILYTGLIYKSIRTGLNGPHHPEAKERPILTVCELENCVTQDVMTHMRTEQERVRRAFNLERAKAADLSLKFRLLRLGQNVELTKE